MMRRFISALGVLALLWLSSCAPQGQMLRPDTESPRFSSSGLVMADGYRLPLRQWLPPDGRADAVLIALHGFNDYLKAFEGAADFWSFGGIAVYAHDQRGFGETEERGLWAGADRLVRDLGAVAALLRVRHPGLPIYVLGESMGGAVAMLAAGEGALSVDGLILLAPALWARETMPILYRAALWLGARLAPGLTLSGRGLGVQASDNIEALRELGRDPLVIKKTRIDAVEGLVDLMDQAYAAAPRIRIPVLVLYGEKDEIVPAAPVLTAYERLGSGEKRFLLYSQGWHLLLKDLGRIGPWADILASMRGVDLLANRPSRRVCQAAPHLMSGRIICAEDAEKADSQRP